MLNNIQAISFDLDDTLWDCAPAIKHAEQTCFDWLKVNAPRVTDTLDLDTLLHRRQQVLEVQPELADDVTRLRQAMLQQTLTEFNYSSELATQAFDVFYKARSQVQLYEGSTDLLTRLYKRYKVAAITNGNADLSIVGIEHYFHSIHKADISNPAKPHRHMFDQCLAGFGLPSQALLHIGDNPITDVAAAKAIGAQSVWFNSQNISWPDGLPRAEYEVESIQELSELLLHR